MLRKIVSFGYRHGNPESGEGVLALDVRALGFRRNPYHDRRLRYLRGTDPRVQEDVRKTPNFNLLYQHLKEAVMTPGLEVVYLGCTGGHHRSVTLVEMLGRELGVPIEHRDLEKP